jgi:hypothetical protein|tara:strand:- start:210 stop:431 length:222 start_codon:yes stop_codon:yes gene_type:complete
MVTGRPAMATKKEKWDGRSRPSNKAYDEGYERIFGKKEEDELKESYKQSVKNKKEREDYFNSKSVKQLLDEME